MLFAAAAFAASVVRPAPESTWETTLDAVVPAVVAIRMSVPRAFDTENASSSVATGFVVDAKNGILLTNRHVVTPGPVVAEAVFLNHEEVPLRAVYRDPVHDFGFYKFDPAALEYMTLTEVRLEPTHARVGAEIRVVGNDAGEKISILQGTLARLDRDAPAYGSNGYNDFDTFYYQAASSTSGGSSGSPVLDEHGHVIALNAGGSNRAASSFFLPLDRVVRALDLVRAGQPVPRGTLQSVLNYRPYGEVRRLGLRPETEAAVRAAFPDGTGMLVVDETVPGGPAYALLQPGDVIVRVDGQLLTTFVPWESVLDEAVGRELKVDVERGGVPLTLAMTVQDLHAITPASYLEAGGGVLNALSFQQARNHALPVKGVYVAFAGHMLSNAGVPEGAVIVDIGGKPVPTLEAAEAALASYADRSLVPVRFFGVSDPTHAQVQVVEIDRRWFPMQRCTRDDTTGLWPCLASPPPPAAAAPPAATTTFPPVDRGPARALAASLVWVDCVVPYRAEGVYAPRFKGTGVVVDAEQGLVLVDRDTVPAALADVSLTFAGSVQVPARVRWVHPTHNLAVVQYDPRLLGDTPVRGARFAPRPARPGDKAWQVGLSARQLVVQTRTRIVREEPLYLSIPRMPFFRDANLSVLSVTENAGAVGGVIADRKGRVQALWASFVESSGDKPIGFFRGIPSALVNDVVAPLRRGEDPVVRTLGAELSPVAMADARHLGLSDTSAAVLEAHAPRERQVLSVTRLVAGTPAAALLREGDLVLSGAGEPITTYRELDVATAAPRVTLRLLRDGKELDVDVATAAFDGTGLTRAILWAGALLHTPHLALAAQHGIVPTGVYVAWSWHGAPAPRYGLRPTNRVVEVDGVPIADLDAFAAAVRGRTEAVRLKLVDLDGRVQVITLEPDPAYWPTAELVREASGWTRRPLE